MAGERVADYADLTRIRDEARNHNLCTETRLDLLEDIDAHVHAIVALTAMGCSLQDLRRSPYHHRAILILHRIGAAQPVRVPTAVLGTTWERLPTLEDWYNSLSEDVPPDSGDRAPGGPDPAPPSDQVAHAIA